MQYSTRILNRIIILDNLETIKDFQKDGGAMSSVKEKRLDGKFVVMKKKLKEDQNNISLTRYFFREAINQILLEHATILPVSGWNFYHYSDSHKMFVYRHSLATEFCNGGTLSLSLLKISNNTKMTRKQIQTQMYLYAYGIARSMKHLFVSKIIHRDLKTQNIFTLSPKWTSDDVPKEIKALIDSEYSIPLLADLGMSKFNVDNEDHSNNCGTAYYEAPEQIQSVEFSFPADVYGYGVTLSDIFQLRKSPKFPNGITRFPPRFYKYVKGGGKPNLDECTENQRNYLMKLLEKDPKDRPNFIQIVDYLETPLKNDTTSTNDEPFIFDDFDLNVIRAYKTYIDLLQNDSTFKRTDEKFYYPKFGVTCSLTNTTILKDHIISEIPNYISFFLNSIPKDSKPNEFYYKEGLQYENQKDYQNAKTAYMRAAIFGSLKSVTKLGILLLKSSSQEKQIQGFNLLKLAADFKEKDGLYSFAYLLTEGFKPKNMKPDLEAAAKLFTKAADLGHQKGWFMAGSIYHQLAFEENQKRHIENAKNYLKNAKNCYQKSFQEFNDKEAGTLLNDISKCLEDN